VAKPSWSMSYASTLARSAVAFIVLAMFLAIDVTSNRCSRRPPSFA
jgi:hypothetical protein